MQKSSQHNLLTKAFLLARSSRSNAYAPYSKFNVGAAVKMQKSSTLYAGCNVENASFGSTICAERNAIAAAIASSGKQQIDFMVVCAEGSASVPPCAACLQVMSEFIEKDCLIYLIDSETLLRKLYFHELLPYRFSVQTMTFE